MFEVVKGWGVWIETFEVTEVQISSHNLFKDLQTNFREKVRKESEICKMQFASELSDIQQKQTAKQAKITREIEEQKSIYTQKINLEINEEQEKFESQKQEINKKKNQLYLEYDIFSTKQE